MALVVVEGVDTSTDVVVIMVAVIMVTESTVDEAMLLTGVDVTVSSTDEVNIMDVVVLVVNGVSGGDDMGISVAVTVSKVMGVEGSTGVLIMLVLVVAIETTVEEVMPLAGVDVEGITEDDMSVDKMDVESVAEMNKELEEVNITEGFGVTIVPGIVVVLGTAEDSNGLEIVTDGVTEVVVITTSEDNDVNMDVRVVVAKVSTGVMLSEITDGIIVVEVETTEVCDVNAVVSGIETMLVEVGIKVSAEVKVTVGVIENSVDCESTEISEETEVGVGRTTVDIITEVGGVESVSGEKVALRETGCSVVITSAVVDSRMLVVTAISLLTLGIIVSVAMVTTVLVGVGGRSAGK